MNDLSRILKNYRIENKLSLRELGEHLGISHTYLSKLEDGYNSKTKKEIAPTIDTLLKIASGLNMDAKTFFEKCGYIDKDDSPKKYNAIEIKPYVKNIIDSITGAEDIIYNGKPLKAEDTKIIAEALEIALEISLRNL